MQKMIEEECARDPEYQIIKTEALESVAPKDKKKKKKSKNEGPTSE